MTLLSLEQAIDRSGGTLHLSGSKAPWQPVDSKSPFIAVRRMERNPLLADAERRRLPETPELELLCSLAGGERNALLADAERRAEQAAQERERACAW